jgi:hypothetical protein
VHDNGILEDHLDDWMQALGCGNQAGGQGRLRTAV